MVWAVSASNRHIVQGSAVLRIFPAAGIRWSLKPHQPRTLSANDKQNFPADPNWHVVCMQNNVLFGQATDIWELFVPIEKSKLLGMIKEPLTGVWYSGMGFCEITLAAVRKNGLE